jgi:hypothetical protein
MPSAYRSVLITLAALLFVAFLFFSYCMFAYRATRLLKASQIPMVWIVLASTLYAICRIVTASIDITNSAVCMAHYWTGHLAFTGRIELFSNVFVVYSRDISLHQRKQILNSPKLMYTSKYLQIECI